MSTSLCQSYLEAGCSVASRASSSASQLELIWLSSKTAVTSGAVLLYYQGAAKCATVLRTASHRENLHPAEHVVLEDLLQSSLVAGMTHVYAHMPVVLGT